MSARQRSSAESGSEKPVMAGKSKPGRPKRPGALSHEEQFERQGVLTALEAGLNEAMPGLEVLDRNLEFDDRVRADLAAVDPRGRLLVVLVAHEDPLQALMQTLDVLAYLRLNSMLLLRHLASRQVDERLEPRVVLIDSANDEVLAARLAPLHSSGVLLYGVRTLRSSGSERSYLVSHGEALGKPEDPEVAIRSFMEALPAQVRALAQRLGERMDALDDQLNGSCDENALIWRWNGMVVARLECRGDRLLASVAPAHQPLLIEDPEAIELLLERALARLMEEYESSAEESRDLPPGLGSLPQGATEPLLTDDEIRAFHS